MDAFRNTWASRLINIIMKDLGLYTSISLGVFIFILFFQPFPVEGLDFNNTLLFSAGLAALVLLIMIIARNLLALLLRRRPEPVLPPYADSIFILVIGSVAYAFYLRFIGEIHISFFIMSKVILICLVPAVVLWVYDLINELKNTNEKLILEKGNIQKQVDVFQDEYLSKTIEFVTEGSGENLKLLLSEIIFVRSADNYVEIVFSKENVIQRKLLRSTLKNIEQLLKPYPNFIRCHRISIVNTFFIEKLTRKFNNHWLTIRGFEDEISVSRQYLVKLREAI